MSAPRTTVCLALALVASLATSALASCMAGPEMSADSQMACCVAGHHECGTKGAAEQCCKNDSQKQQQVIVAKHELVRSPLTTLQHLLAIPTGTTVTVNRTPAVNVPHRVVLKGPFIPKYLLASALLI